MSQNDMWFKLTEKQRFNDGTTAVCTILRESTLYAANVGDSRAILLRDRKAIQLTNDHKPMKYARLLSVVFHTFVTQYTDVIRSD